jgi:hypothetical protein
MYPRESRYDFLDRKSTRRKVAAYTQDNTSTGETQTDIHVSIGIRTQDSSVWAGWDISRHRSRCHCDRQNCHFTFYLTDWERKAWTNLINTVLSNSFKLYSFLRARNKIWLLYKLLKSVTLGGSIYSTCMGPQNFFTITVYDTSHEPPPQPFLQHYASVYVCVCVWERGELTL